jgi:Flp pilus assembly protein TadG
MRRERQRGQAAVEVVAVAVALGFLLLVGWQAVVAAYTWQTAQSAARTAARAGSVGAPVERAALAVLPNRLATRAKVVIVTDRAGRIRVRVRLSIPRVLSGRGTMGTVDGEAAVVR